MHCPTMPDCLPDRAVPPTKAKQGVPPPGPHPKRSTAMTQLLKLQELLFEDACSDESKGKRFLSSRAWKELQELKLRLQMKAPPKPVDVAELERAKAKARERRAVSKPIDPGWRPTVVKPGASPAPAPPAQDQTGAVG